VIAQQLTLMSKHLWDKLSIWEFHGLAFTKDKKEELAPTVCSMIRHVNKVGDLCKTVILESDDVKRRGASITMWIRVVEQLLLLRNFSDAMGLVTALQATR
jgi:hypothetical protein